MAYKDPNDPRAKERKKRYRERHLEQCKEECRNYKRAHREQIKISKRKWDLANKATKAKHDRTYREKHKAELKIKARNKYLRNKAYYAEKHKRWREANPEKARALVRTRENRVKAALGGGDVGNVKAIREWEYSWKNLEHVTCTWCKCDMAGKDAEMDHIIALSIGGSHTLENLCICCPTCNRRKKNKPLEEWLSESGAI